LLRQQLARCAQRVDEAEVEHLVGLVEHEISTLRRSQRALVDQVEQAAGRGDEDVDAVRAASRICLLIGTPPNTTFTRSRMKRP
jgi:hypothetical protein